MEQFLNQLLYQFYPYIAIAVLLIGSWLRLDRDSYTWRSGSSQLLSSRGMRWGSNLFHVGVLAILAGHFVGLLTPHFIYEPIISTPHKQLLAMGVGGVFGLMCLVGMTILLARRLFNPRIRATGSRSDLVVLLLLYAQLLLGLASIFVSAGHLDGAQMVLLAEWAQHIVTFRWGAASYIESAHWIYKAHVFLGMTLLLIFPFTRLVHIWSMPISYLRRPYQVVRKRQSVIRYGG
ncbi:MAG: respiratory nitrate reductase subunit gamma [Pseudomonadales bacterium]|nr:respiratory nitrate reductase subunit gamma [Pseudomonadales bacterium]